MKPARRRALASSIFEPLEGRQLLSATHARASVIKPHYADVSANGSGSPTSSMHTPAQIRIAYGFDKVNLNGIVGDGTGQTIAIIDAFDNPNFVNSTASNFNTSDLYKFDHQFGLPDPPSFKKVNETGGTTPPSYNQSWSGEIALDVEWSHAIAPGANIVLIEATSASTSDLEVTAADTARNMAGVSVVSMSFGGGESSSEKNTDTHFTTPSNHQGVTFVASTGDDGWPGEYPAYSPNVVAVGGTSLTINSSTSAYSSETSWNNSYGATGGGISTTESKPSYQNGVVTQTSTHRATPDISFDADPNTGVAVCDTANGGASTPWLQYGGTSLSAPCIAGMIAIADQARVANGLTTMDGRSTTLPRLYQAAATDFHDITSGTNNHFSAGAGYDLVSGRGTPIANLLLNDLSGIAPALATPATPALMPSSDSGISNSDNITNVTTPTFTGTATAGSTVNLFADNTQIGTGIANISGVWTIMSSALTAGNYNITAVSTNGTLDSNTSAALGITIDTTPPTVTPATFQSDTTQSLTYQFSESLGVAPTTANLQLQNLTTDTTVNTTANYNAAANTVTFTFPAGILADGNYQATLSTNGITDVAGNALSAGNTDAFSFLNGDANHDGVVNMLDMNVLATNFGKTSGVTFSQGDFDYNGQIDAMDFNILAAHFGDQLPGASQAIVAAIPASSAAQPTSLFSDKPVDDSTLVQLV